MARCVRLALSINWYDRCSWSNGLWVDRLVLLVPLTASVERRYKPLSLIASHSAINNASIALVQYTLLIATWNIARNLVLAALLEPVFVVGLCPEILVRFL
jgi:hypothetical protein